MSKAKRALVLGGAGFLGSHLADELSDAGFDVSIFDVVDSPWLRPDQTMIRGDMLNKEQVNAAIRGKDYVYHLAGVADIGFSATNPYETMEKNILGSLNVLEACVANKVQRFLFASTVYVYSDKGSFYRISKQAVEWTIEAYHEQHGLAFTILRFGSLYGPRAQEWNGLKRFITQGVRARRIEYPGTGQERREYIHVKDAVKLSVDVLAPEYANECLTVTGAQVLTTKEVLQMIREISGEEMELAFSPEGSTYRQSHYSLTPYRYTPRQGKKIVPNTFIDLGQGILDIIEEIHQAENGVCAG